MIAWPQWLPMSASKAPLKYSPYRLPTNSTGPTTGCVMKRENRECRNASSIARGETSPGWRGPGSVRSARVIGAPSTRKIGATIDSSMCDAMWALNSTCEYSPSPPNVAQAMTTMPSEPRDRAPDRPRVAAPVHDQTPRR